jgi:hypothetical protein
MTKIAGMGRWMDRNHLTESLRVVVRQAPKGRLTPMAMQMTRASSP